MRRILVECPLVHNRDPKTTRKFSNFLVVLHVEAKHIARKLFDIPAPADIAVAENLLLIRQDVLLQRVVEVQQEIQLEARIRHCNLGDPGEHVEVRRIELGIALVHIGIEEHNDAIRLGVEPKHLRIASNEPCLLQKLLRRGLVSLVAGPLHGPEFDELRGVHLCEPHGKRLQIPILGVRPLADEEAFRFRLPISSSGAHRPSFKGVQRGHANPPELSAQRGREAGR